MQQFVMTLLQTEGRQWQQKSQAEVSGSQVLTLLPSSSSLWQIFTLFQNSPRKILYSVDKIFQVVWKIFLSPLNTALYILNQRVSLALLSQWMRMWGTVITRIGETDSLESMAWSTVLSKPGLTVWLILLQHRPKNNGLWLINN